MQVTSRYTNLQSKRVLILYSTCTFWMPTRGGLLIKRQENCHIQRHRFGIRAKWTRAQILLGWTSIPWTSRGSFWRCSILPKGICHKKSCRIPREILQDFLWQAVPRWIHFIYIYIYVSQSLCNFRPMPYEFSNKQILPQQTSSGCWYGPGQRQHHARPVSFWDRPGQTRDSPGRHFTNRKRFSRTPRRLTDFIRMKDWIKNILI